MVETVKTDKIISDKIIWKNSTLVSVVLIASIALLLYISRESLYAMLRTWEGREEYSYAYMIPFISVFLIWQRKDTLEKQDFQGSWAGVLVTILGIIVVLVGNVSATHIFTLYGLLITLVGIAYSCMGASVKIIIVPILFLFFMIPLPGIFLFRLSSELQLISSQLGVWVIRLLGVSVYLAGNVIDLGKFQLQVAEACSGLRYLFPLISLSFIVAYFFSVSFWKRAIIVVSSVPITIFMNSFRIGVIGVLVEYYGIAQAEGFLHQFEGWVVFMFSVGLLLLEMLLLLKLSGDKRPFSEVFGVYLPDPSPVNAKIRHRRLGVIFISSLIALVIALVISITLGQRAKPKLERQNFTLFPMGIGNWIGGRDRLKASSLKLLKLNDYVIADYINKNTHAAVNFYVAYYNSQEPGDAAHSPKTCLPGGGWRIKQYTKIIIPGLSAPDISGKIKQFKVNRFVIQKGETRQVVYYWFQQRGRIIASEYMVKWYLLHDAIMENRTDGALVRITSMVQPDEDIKNVDARIIKFSRVVEPVLKNYIPD